VEDVALARLDVRQAVAVEDRGHDRGSRDDHGRALGLERRDPPAFLERLRDRLAATPLEERRRIPSLEPERAPVIVAGAAIVAAILDRYGLREVEASERDILHGAALEAASLD